MEALKATDEQTQYLTFYIADEEYAAGVLQVKEIIEYSPVTNVPSTPPWIRGVINLRGSVVPVVDLALKFGLPSAAVTPRTCVVLVEVDLGGERTVMGIIADSVSRVVELTAQEIEPAPAFGTQVRVDYLKGMGRAGKKFVLMLDIDRVLSANELLAAAVAAQSRAAAPQGVAPPEEQEPRVRRPPARRKRRRAGSPAEPAAGNDDAGREQE